MKWAALTKPITRAGLFMGRILWGLALGYMFLSCRDAASSRNVNRCHQSTPAAAGDGVHLIARHYRKGVRFDSHLHREAQPVYVARCTMHVPTPSRSRMPFAG